MDDLNLAGIGIDVAKATLDVHQLLSGQSRSWSNDVAGRKQLREELPPADGCLIVLEATGGYERPLVAELLDAGYRVAVVNPKRVRDFARALGLAAKTDRLDARVLALFAEKMQPSPVEKTPEKQAELQQLVVRRRQLVDLRTMESNRLDTTTLKKARRSIDAVLKLLDRQIADLEADIRERVESDDDWKLKAQIVKSVPGLGGVTATTFLTEFPELGKLNRQEASSLAGLAPFNRDSGQQQGKRAISGGRKTIRSVLYMAALAARRCNPVIRDFADRLTQRGKPFKVMITACMRKLLVIVNALVKTGQTWRYKSTP